MSNIKNTPEWKQYEWLISKIFHDQYYSIETTILPNAKIHGKFSKRSRQIDILVTNNNVKTIIECKHHKTPLDVKDIESFISMFSDTNANNGIIISSSGFSKSAYNRISEYEKQIKLEHLDWEKAYLNSFSNDSYGKISDLCEHCNDNESGTEVPGLLLWQGGYGLEKNGILYIYHIAECLKCNNITIYCDSCGVITSLNEDEICCLEAEQFIQQLTKDITNHRSQ